MRKPNSPINQRFDIEIAQAESMWHQSVLLPAETGHDTAKHAKTIRRSQDGAWLIRKFHAPLKAERQAALMDRELARLQQVGMNVMSYATATASTDPKAFYIVSPWIEGLTICQEDSYKRNIVPTLLDYYGSSLTEAEQNPAHAYYGSELVLRGQYVNSPDSDLPIYLDIAPDLVQGTFWAQHHREQLLNL